MRAKFSTSLLLSVLISVGFAFFCSLSGHDLALADWKLDLSRRLGDQRKSEIRGADSDQKQKDSSIFDGLLASVETDNSQEIVILNTEGGFVPDMVRVREGSAYKIHVVNINEKERNVSFVMDAFSEHHATYFGKLSSFSITPKKEGIYSFVCPETSSQGRMVVLSSLADQNQRRQPASEQ
ncbi:MAG: cupredoxin domain-containing protein [Bdellovibrionales bacterium]|nr:cupredoxin domain-containing protein [Bdellovibrionales bacterium]